MGILRVNDRSREERRATTVETKISFLEFCLREIEELGDSVESRRVQLLVLPCATKVFLEDGEPVSLLFIRGVRFPVPLHEGSEMGFGVEKRSGPYYFSD